GVCDQCCGFIHYMAYHVYELYICFFFSSRRRHTRCYRDWSSDVCSSDLLVGGKADATGASSEASRRKTGAPGFHSPTSAGWRTLRIYVVCRPGCGDCHASEWAEVHASWRISKRARRLEKKSSLR